MLMRRKEYIVYRITRASFGRINLIDIKKHLNIFLQKMFWKQEIFS